MTLTEIENALAGILWDFRTGTIDTGQSIKEIKQVFQSENN